MEDLEGNKRYCQAKIIAKYLIIINIKMTQESINKIFNERIEWLNDRLHKAELAIWIMIWLMSDLDKIRVKKILKEIGY